MLCRSIQDMIRSEISMIEIRIEITSEKSKTDFTQVEFSWTAGLYFTINKYNITQPTSYLTISW